MVEHVCNIVAEKLDALSLNGQCIVQDGNNPVLYAKFRKFFLYLGLCPSGNLPLHHLMDSVKQVMTCKANGLLQFLKFIAFLRNERTERVINCILVKVKACKRFPNRPMSGELYSDVSHYLLLVTVLRQEIAEQVYYLICRLLCSCATKFLFWSVFQNPEWSASLLCTLLGHVLPSFGFIDRFAVLKLKDLLHIRLEFLPYFRAGGKIIVDNFLFAEAGNHRG